MSLNLSSFGTNTYSSSSSNDLLSHSLIVGREIRQANTGRQTYKVSSYRGDMHGPNVADAVQRAEVFELRSQLRALPDQLKEQLRHKYVVEKDVRQREQQEYQLHMLWSLEKLLRKNMKAAGIDHKKFEIGGYERGTYGTQT
jgi:hypothetical protein